MTYLTPTQWKALGQFTEVDGRQVFYREAGAGEVLLLIHGFPTSSWDWWKAWPDLEERYHLLAPDMFGFGFSDKDPKYSYTIGQQVDMIQALLQQKDITSFHILCHNYGVSVVQELVARNNEDARYTIGSICFLNGGMFPESYKPRIIQKLLLGPLGPIVARLSSKSRLRKTFHEIFGPNTLPTEQEIDDFWYLMNYNNGKAIIHKVIQYIKERQQNADRWTNCLLECNIPMRLINGPEDPISGIRLAERYRQIIPQADVVLLDSIGHYPQTEAPKKVLQHYLHFRDRLA